MHLSQSVTRFQLTLRRPARVLLTFITDSLGFFLFLGLAKLFLV